MSVTGSTRAIRGTSDLIDWGLLVEDGIVLTKSGNLIAGWYYQAPDLAVAPQAQREATADQVSAALAGLGGDIAVHIDYGRIPTAEYPETAEWPDAATAAIDAERRSQAGAAGAQFEALQSLVVTYTPPAEAEAKLGRYFYSDPATAGEGSASAALEHFKALMVDFEDRIAGALRVDRMRGYTVRGRRCDALLSHLRWCLHGVFLPVAIPDEPVYLDNLLNATEMWSGLTPVVEDQYIQVVAVDGFPDATWSGALDALAQLPHAYRWSTRFIALDRVQAETAINTARKGWAQKTRGIVDQVIRRDAAPSSRISADASTMVADADQALAVAQGDRASFGYVSTAIVFRGPELAAVEEAARDARKILLALGFGARLETINTVEAFLGSLPGHLRENVRRPLLHSRHLANLVPLSSPWTGALRCPCPLYPPDSPPLLVATAASAPFRLNLHVGDLGHTLIFGPTGAGKSTLLALLAAQFRRYPNATVHAFDKGRSLEALTLAVGGEHYDVTGDADAGGFTPLAGLTEPGATSWAAGWIEALCKLQGHEVLVKERNEIGAALAALAAAKERPASVTALQIQIQNQAIKEALQPYTLNGVFDGVLDAEPGKEAAANAAASGPWCCYEVGELMNRDDKIRLPVLLHLFRQVERQLTGQPALIILDEAWVMLGHEVFRDKIREWLKTLRKHNAAVVLATQSLSDASRSGIVDVLAESTATLICLPNAEAGTEVARPFYQALGLDAAAVEAIAAARPKREYYVRQASGQRLIDLRLGPTALAFCAVAPADLPELRERQRERGEQWVTDYLAERGLGAAA